MTNDSVTQLGEFEDGDDRWRVVRCSTPAGSWIEVRTYERDVGDGDPYVMTGVMAMPAGVARKIAQTISQEFDVPLSIEMVPGDLIVETLRLLIHFRARDVLRFQGTLRDVHLDPETVNTVIGQLCSLTSSAMEEYIDDENIDAVLARWLSEALGVDDVGGEQIDDAEIAAFLDRQQRRDD